jgi:hypothetical protein
VLPTAAERERVLAEALAPELLDDAPLPMGLPMTFTRGLETEVDCEPDELIALALLLEPDDWAKAEPPRITNAVAVRNSVLMSVS